MNRSMDSFDKELSKALKEFASSISAPDKDEVWAEILQETKSKTFKPKTPIFKKWAIAMTIILILLGGLFANTGNHAVADFRFFQIIKTVIGNVASIAGVARTGNNVPALGNQGVEETITKKSLCTLKEAQESLSYDILLPKYVPEAYALIGVYISEKKDTLSSIELHYLHSESGKELVIDETPASRISAFSYNYRSNDAEQSNVQINGCEATLIFFQKTGVRRLIWQTSTMYFMVSSDLNEEEITNVSESLSQE